MSAPRTWPRPVPLVGDPTSASERAADPEAWAFEQEERLALEAIIGARRDIRRFRPDPVPDDKVRRLLRAAHHAPSVGHSQPWRFVVVTEAEIRARASVMADRARLAQAAAMDADSGRHLLDLDLEGIREAPLGIVVCCDRRLPAAGVLGRATFTDADMWSCACAIENLWLTARAEGLGVGWVTLFEPADLAALISAPSGIETLGWLCVGWPDERPPTPGLERRGWSHRMALDEVVLHERWPGEPPLPPRSHLAMPDQRAVVAAHDGGDHLLTPAGSLGVLDRAVDRLLAVLPDGLDGPGVLILAAADHPVAGHGVSAFEAHVTRTVAEAAVAGVSLGAVAASTAGLSLQVVDAGIDGPPLPGAVAARPAGAKGDLVTTDVLTQGDADGLIAAGERLAAGHRLIALGEVGVGNTTVASALAAALLQCPPAEVIGRGAASDSDIVAKKAAVVTEALRRVGAADPQTLLARIGGELAVLAGVVLGAAREGAVVVLDGMATSVAALAAVLIEPAAASHLIAGQRSREPGHARVLTALGLEPLLDLRLRAGEGVGAAMSVSLLTAALAMRQDSARTE